MKSSKLLEAVKHVQLKPPREVVNCTNTTETHEPVEDTEYEVEYEERSEDDKSDEVDPRP